MYSSFISLGKFIPRYLILFVALVNGIYFLISLSDFSLLVYRNASDFCFDFLCDLLVIQKCVVQPPYVGVFNSFSPVIEI